jgi:hypothetical protein
MPPPRLVKVVLLLLDKVLPKLKVVRVRHSPGPEDDQRQSDPTVTHHESHIPPGITSTSTLQMPLSNLSLGSEVSTTESYYRQGSDMAQVYLPVVRAIAGAIPIAGAPIQAVIAGLLAILQTLDVRKNFVDRRFPSFNGIIDKRSE